MEKIIALDILAELYSKLQPLERIALETLVPELGESDKTMKKDIGYLINHNNYTPKFKEGDWITNGEVTFKIDKVFDTNYTDTAGAVYNLEYTDVNYHLWSIEDAKDGDVLAAHECYVIFKEIDRLNIKCYCTYHYMGFNPSFYVDTLQNKTVFYPATKEQRYLLFKKMHEAGYKWNAETKELKEIEQKSNNNTRPKFKVGDWCIDNEDDTIFQIMKVLDHTYRYKTNDGDEYSCTHYSLEDDSHLWSIEDAKDGDVLSFNDGHGNNNIELIKSITSKKIEFWFYLTNGNRYEAFDGITPYTNLISRKDATPATKEQRDLLFKKMHEAGYTWDAETKELKEIEQKSNNNTGPKFKVGDWVQIDGGHVMNILEVKKDVLCYRILNWCGNESVRKFSDIDSIAHLWTIQDAKDGDVLAWDDSKCIALFKNIYDENSFNSYGFVGGCTGTFESRQTYHDIEGAHPATKEQRDLLFKKMHEAGYKWNTGENTLKKNT